MGLMRRDVNQENQVYYAMYMDKMTKGCLFKKISINNEIYLDETVMRALDVFLAKIQFKKIKYKSK